MELALLYSGGKDSSLAAVLLDRFYDVRCVTGSFGLTDDWEHAARAADALGFSFDRVDLDPGVAAEAAETMVDDGYPRNGIQRVHEHALETIADRDVDAIADGTRRDDRVPTVSHAQAQSLESRHGVDYLSPLSGFGRHAVDRLVEATFEVEQGPSEEVPKADYEDELRTLIADTHSTAAVEEIFPAHHQTYVRGRTD
jgi:predicted subunit of tRNA(5-methylaminomethyl-2-thiouridylate) methyltransferase